MRLSKTTLIQVFVVVFSVTFIFQCYYVITMKRKRPPKTKRVEQMPQIVELSTKRYTSRKKLILFWTTYQKDKTTLWWKPPGGYQQYIASNCDYKGCEFTNDKDLVSDATMILFNSDKLREDGNDWPTVRHPHQLYVHYLAERPGKAHEFLTDYEGKINLTLNYREEADITIPFQQLFMSTLSKEKYLPKIPLQTKTKMIVWPVSHCNAESKRDAYAFELDKHIEVDIYGKCGNYECKNDNDNSCMYKWEKQYKFYLSFENAICDDYITEKFYKPLNFELIPIILSGPRYNSQVPPHSYIDVRDYDSPKQLAEYLHMLSQNETAYYEYFAWKTKYSYGMSQPNALCKLCEAANVVKNKPARTDYFDWWYSKCDNGLVGRMRKQGGW